MSRRLRVKTISSVHPSVHQGVHSSSSNAETCFNVQIFSFNSVLIRERSVNLKRGYGFFLRKDILIPNVAEKNILILVEEKKII